MTSSHSTSSVPACLLCGADCALRYDFGEFRVAYCATCRLGCLDPFPTDAKMAELYRSQEYFEGVDDVGYEDYLGEDEEHAMTFRAKLKDLLATGSVNDLLEIGCGPGAFLREATAAGIPRVVGLDLNPWAIKYAKSCDLDASVGSIEDLPAERQFDAVAMLDLIEHIRNPVEFLRAVADRLRPGGRVLVMTPNVRSLLAFISGRRWVSFKIPEHLFYYSPFSIDQVLHRAGFEIVARRSARQYVTVDFVLSRLDRLVPPIVRAVRPVTRALGLDSRIISVTNGSMDIVARKVA